jgi:CheY-like chemotaxis protein
VSGPVQPLSILVVDDEPEVAAILGDLLTIQGHRIEVSPNGAVALERLRHQSYDLIVSHLRMPQLDGLGLYKRLHRTKHPLRSRLVFVTGDTLAEEARIFLRKTSALCIGKPLVPEEITSVVRKAVLRPIAS